LGYEGEPLEGVAVRAYQPSDLDNWLVEANANASGFYQLTLSPGDWKIRVAANVNSVWPHWRFQNYRNEWYDDATNGAEAATLSVSEGVYTPGIDFDLVYYPGIGGVISNTAGERLSYVVLWVYGVSTGATSTASGWANEWGEFLFTSLNPGDYKIEIDTRFNAYYTDNPYLHIMPEWYDDKELYTQADVVTLEAGSNMYLHVELTPYGIITGHVYEAGSGIPVEGVQVGAQHTGGDGRGWLVCDTDSNGAYRVCGVDGSYRLHADPGSLPYVPQYYSNKADQGSADLVALQIEQVVSNIDFHLTKFTAGSISGYVWNPDGTPASSTVRAYGDEDDWYDTTDGSGYYQITGLPEGDYWLRAGIYGYQDLYYCQQSSYNNRHFVHVTPGHDTDGINFQFMEGGTVYGTVTDPDGAPLEGMPVKLWHLTGGGGADTTDASGYYEMTKIAPGLARIYIDPTDTSDPDITPYLKELYEDVYDVDLATLVTIEDGVTNGPINIQANLGGTVTGQLTIAGTSPCDLRVTLYPLEGGSDWLGGIYGEAECDGSYVVDGIPPGDYTVRGEDTGNKVCLWYDEQAAQGDADIVTLVSNETVSGIDLTYVEEGTISGKIKVGGTSTGIYEAHVRLLSTNGSLVGRPGQGWTEADGTYTLDGLPPGTFKLAACPHYSNEEYGGTRAYEFYGETRNFASATAVVLTEGGSLTGIDIGLESVAGTVAGTVVRDADSTPLSNKYVELVVDGLPDVFVAETQTDVNGDYTMVGVPAGSYHAYYYQSAGSPFQDQHYDRQPDPASADTIVTTGGSTTGINFRMYVKAPDSSPKVLAPLWSSEPNPPTFEWTAIEDVVFYELKVDDITGGTNDAIRAVVAGLIHTPSNTLAVGHHYESRVRCGAVGAWGPWSSPVPFEQLPPPNYDLDVFVSGEGYVDLTPAGGSYPAGTQVGLTAVPTNGANFDSWSAGVSNRFTESTTIGMDTNYTITVYFTPNIAPLAPVNLYPSNMALHVSLAPLLESSLLDDPDVDNHALSYWQIRDTTGTYSAPVYSSGLSTSLTEILVPPGHLTYTSYWWRVKHRDEWGAESPWSSETVFDTTPTIDDVYTVDTNAVVAFPTAFGYLYTVQYIDDLITGTWSNVPGMVDIPGNNDYLLYTNTIPIEGAMLFRTLVNPAP
jgi:hypothetical protein